MKWTTPITNLAGVGPAHAKKLARLKILTIGDLLQHAPRRYEDWTVLRPIRTVRIGEAGIVIRGKVQSITARRSPRKRLHLTHAVVSDESGQLLATWFNQPYLLRLLREGATYYFRGTVGYDREHGLKTLQSPQIERLSTIMPVYPETHGLTSRQLRNLVDQVFTADLDPVTLLPEVIERDENLLSAKTAYRALHQPTNLIDTEKASLRLAFEELFVFLLALQQLHEELGKHRAPACAIPNGALKDFVAQLPFQLTGSQRRAAWQVISDLRQSTPMNRLIEGDVGSGKTVVAALAAYALAYTGYQTLWMAPTEILARQHVATLTTLLAPFEIPVGLWVGTEKQAATADRPGLIVGTHALLHHAFPRVGLVIIDEQHRFGVDQRAALRSMRENQLIPHFLSMTATPIPRTLALALYGELDSSLIKERPGNRQSITTTVIDPARRDAMYELIERELAAGRQAFVVCPLIEESQRETTHPPDLFGPLEKVTVAAMSTALHRVFPRYHLGLLHGKLPPKEKQTVMTAFHRGDIDLLVATAVIEVGIDVPNASVMLIEGAEQFGLAQLHQLRGRVGRGAYPGYCFLVPSFSSPAVEERLRALEQSTDGFALAELDLKLRGPGNFLGSTQSGLPQFRFASLMDFDLIRRVRAAAARAAQEGLIDRDRATQWFGSPAAHLE